MTYRHFGWLPLGMVLLMACEPGADEPIDPGRPNVTFGPRCSITLDGAPIKTLEQCTAIATIYNGQAHLFLELYPDREPHDVERYASIVVPARDWQEGRFSQATAGRIEVTFKNGGHYRLSPDGNGQFPIDLDISSADAADEGDHHILRGELEATLPGVSGTEGRIGFRAVIN